jgi:hypothetical protein
MMILQLKLEMLDMLLSKTRDTLLKRHVPEEEQILPLHLHPADHVEIEDQLIIFQPFLKTVILKLIHTKDLVFKLIT